MAAGTRQDGVPSRTRAERAAAERTTGEPVGQGRRSGSHLALVLLALYVV